MSLDFSKYAPLTPEAYTEHRKLTKGEHMISYDFTGKTVVVTGSARGIGRRCAERFLEAGANVALCGHSPRNIDDLLAELEPFTKGHNERVMYATCDVADAASIDAFFTAVVERFGAFDILVNNAGIWEATPVGSVTEEMWQRNIDTNLKSQLVACDWFARWHQENGGGQSIVNISSVSSVLTGENTPLYNLCKAATNSLTRTYAHGLGSLGINVNAVGPGTIATDINKAAYADPAAEAAMCDSLVMGRRGKTDDIANAVLFLASEESNYITGQVLFVDGGWLLQQAPKK